MPKKTDGYKRPETKALKVVETIKHKDATRKHIPSAEMQPVMQKLEQSPIQVSFSRRADGLEAEKQNRNRDLDPQLVWRSKDQQDRSDLIVHAPPLYIQEKVHPKALIDDLRRSQANGKAKRPDDQPDLFSDFNGIPEGADKTDFYQHEGKWQNRMILGDSLQVMASLAERERLRGQVQCIYIDPPYGIKFNSNFQWSTTDKAGTLTDSIDKITREPEQVKAFRDTWRDGIHSYLSYLRDRLVVARELLCESGSIFVQIGDENVHRVRSLLDEVFGGANFLSLISYKTTQSAGASTLDSSADYILWYAREKERVRFYNPLKKLERGDKGATRYNYAENCETGEIVAVGQDESDLGENWRFFTDQGLTSRGLGSENTMAPLTFMGQKYRPTAGHWRTSAELIQKRLIPAGRVMKAGKTLRYKKYFDDFGCLSLNNLWDDVGGGIQSRNDPKIYVVQTSTTVVQRCILMATQPGDLVLDPTCGSGTTAYVAEQWGRRWITIDTSRVALALARSRLMGARFPYYLLADSPEGQRKDADLRNRESVAKECHWNIRLGFVYERVPHVRLELIAKNAEIDVICERYQPLLDGALAKLNSAAGETWEWWEVPQEPAPNWASATRDLYTYWRSIFAQRWREINASIAANAELAYIYDKPYEDKTKVRVSGPFTVESLSPLRSLPVDEADEVFDPGAKVAKEEERDFVRMILENLRTAGVQQAHKEDRIEFTCLKPWPGHYICGEGTYTEGDRVRRAGVFIGPEFGTVPRPDLVAAAREACEADFDVLISCAFNYEALSTEFDKLGRIPVLKARINADMHMSDELKNTGKGNLFVIFGEPDINILDATDGRIQVKLNGVDVFKPQLGKVESSSPNEIACWFIDTDYDEESFFARHAYFLGANDPYKALKTTLKAEIDEEAWATLHSGTSRPFDKPASGRIAVKVINHLGDEVMKVFRVS